MLTGFEWAAAAVIVAGISWVLSTATKTGIGDIVEKKLHLVLHPLHKQLEKQEKMIEGIGTGLDDANRRGDQEHLRLWNAIDELRGRK